MDTAKMLVSTSTAHMGKEKHAYRCLRIQNRSSASGLLKPPPRSNGNSNGCTLAELAEEWFVFKSTLEIDLQSDKPTVINQDSRRSFDRFTVANAVLVAHAEQVDVNHSTDNDEDKNWTLIAWRLSNTRRKNMNLQKILKDS
ncbi:hypothetical protein G6F70_008682 [Rhizopus microsporus]|uniref:Uncharacterized protein n=1 Tax=Rhizopus azygosporus TaxID=86630 RepID=A0A367JFS3_RHIAZ|nr:hypothetical protein G6F71_008634 [Rhizopus microsporus]RCH88803.1 hypothetical protein CU097_008414 [Rhizopus azygosporus]KAG1194854.1 hypothetical protein G6F70_008682 [Rhizopus microsporus]KAG1206698.1 hypothetical protein G6F69_008635 [Rhizopus microsporus]KAG1227199.1 hypothetical protein G6F67_008593 [Rhizopus microsporus]